MSAGSDTVRGGDFFTAPAVFHSLLFSPVHPGGPLVVVVKKVHRFFSIARWVPALCSDAPFRSLFGGKPPSLKRLSPLPSPCPRRKPDSATRLRGLKIVKATLA